MSDHHQISVYLDKDAGLDMNLICHDHDEDECFWREFLEEVGGEEFMLRYTGRPIQFALLTPRFTATDEYDMNWSL